MEAFVAVAKAGDESQKIVSSSGPLESAFSNTSNSETRGRSTPSSNSGTSSSSFPASLQQHVQALSNSHHLENSPYWKYLVGDAAANFTNNNLNKESASSTTTSNIAPLLRSGNNSSSLSTMVPQEPSSMATNDGGSILTSSSNTKSLSPSTGESEEHEIPSALRPIKTNHHNSSYHQDGKFIPNCTSSSNNSSSSNSGNNSTNKMTDGILAALQLQQKQHHNNHRGENNSSATDLSGSSSPVTDSVGLEPASTSVRNVPTSGSNNNSISSNNNGDDRCNIVNSGGSGSKPDQSSEPLDNRMHKRCNSTGGESQSGSDVERFDGKIVYNPDGSAYIIEDSEMSEDENSLDMPHLEGCIVDGRGVSLSQIPAIPQIANAIYVSRNPALYNALYGSASFPPGAHFGGSGGTGGNIHDKKLVPDIPIMHSYRVFTVRDNKSGDTGSAALNEDDDDEESAHNLEDKSKVTSTARSHLATASECSSVPIKPILMCFICKLSFGFTKSFVGHAMGDHNLILNEQEKEILNQRNASAIIQSVGKNKETLLSFLEPTSQPGTGKAPFFPPQPPSSRVAAQHQSSASSTATSSSELQQSLLAARAAAAIAVSLEEQGRISPVTATNLSSPRKDSSAPTISSPDHMLSSPQRPLSTPNDLRSCPTPSSSSPGHLSTSKSHSGSSPNLLSVGIDLTRKSPAGSGRSSSASPGASASPNMSVTPNSVATALLHNSNAISSHFTLGAAALNNANQGNNNGSGPPNFITGTTIGVCPEHINGRPSGVDCSKCEMILNSSRMGGLGGLHTRNSCKTLKCPKCNWHYKYQETLEIHMKEKHPDNETSCIYCITSQPHPRLARGETYTCGYKPYRCEVCNYSTTTKGNLSIHMQSDKHLNNMQELQNGGVPPPEALVQQTNASNKALSGMSPGSGSGGNRGDPISGSGNGASSGSNPKPKPTFRCDVCNYETNVARNLRIHMTSEKHTHNMMVLQQNVKHMQHLSALQQAQQASPFDQAMLQFHPGMAGVPDNNKQSGGGNNNGAPNEAALADMAYNQALLIQMMTGGHIPPHIPPEMAPHMDLGLNPETMEPPPEPPEPNPSHLFQCCVCSVHHTDSLEGLSHHLSLDRTKTREQEILVLVAGNYMCKLCSYKTNLKANFQLHCKTDKHLQRLQHVNHVKEGGPRNEWKLKYLSMSNPIQVRCNACDYYTNSAHKLQLHAAHQRHELSVLLFKHIAQQESEIHEEARIYACALCGFTSHVKLQLFQHTK